ncbi:Uncharacterized protein Fot_05191 [Forsythia ovata]|uniref:Uncharacterized protein n=1 Tax=Forsythia ovata TaxID=205694 RepID=A0ABD1WPF8_9LAMI
MGEVGVDFKGGASIDNYIQDSSGTVFIRLSHGQFPGSFLTGTKQKLRCAGAFLVAIENCHAPRALVILKNVNTHELDYWFTSMKVHVGKKIAVSNSSAHLHRVGDQGT